MTIDHILRDRIEGALKSKKLDATLKFEYHNLLGNDARDLQDISITIDTGFSCIAEGKKGLDFPGKRQEMDTIYTLDSTYRNLLDLVEMPDFVRFEKGRSPHTQK